MSWFHPKTLLDKSYEIGILVKGIDGFFELLGGILLLAVAPQQFGTLTRWMVQGVLDRNPDSFVANHIEHVGQHLAAGRDWFAIAFLLLHGIIKLVLVIALLRNKQWAYPFALVTLGLFLVYQAYLLVTSPTISMAFLTALDVAIIWLVWREWHQVKSEDLPKKAAT